MDSAAVPKVGVGGVDLDHQGAGLGVLGHDGGVAGLGELGRGVVGVEDVDADNGGGGSLVGAAVGHVGGQDAEEVVVLALAVQVGPAEGVGLHHDVALEKKTRKMKSRKNSIFCKAPNNVSIKM